MAGPLTPPVGTRFSTGQDLALLDGPTSAPSGAVVVSPGGTSLDSLTSSNPAGTTFYLLAGRHLLSGGSPDVFSQVSPKDGNTYIGAPGAVLDGQNIAQYAFSQQATGVTISYLEITNFSCPFDEFCVNHDAGPSWTIEYCHIHHCGGAGVGIGSNNTLRYCWLHHGQQYGFSSFKFPVNDGQTSAITNVLIDHCEISHCGDMRDEYGPDGSPSYNGRNGSCKFWDTQHIVFSNSWLHHSSGIALWADTNDIDCLVDSNLFEDNSGVAFFYEISYNFRVVNNTFRRNGVQNGLKRSIGGDNFPSPAIYISESGGDSRVSTNYATSTIENNTFVNNWDDVVLWENADRFCNSPANTSSKIYKPRGGTASLAVCNVPTPKTLTVTLTSGSPTFTITAGTFEDTDEGRFISGTGIPAGTRIKFSSDSNGFTKGYISSSLGVMTANATASGSITMTLGAGSINTEPGFSDCRWQTKNITVRGNTFDHNRTEVYGPRNAPNVNPLVISGKHAVISVYGSYPSWSPYQGTTIQNKIVTQGNLWLTNTYRGDYHFVTKDTSNQIEWTDWRSSPYSQDSGSTLTTTAPTGGGGGTVYLPDPPTNVVAAAGNGQARVSFRPPVDDGGDVLIGYTVTASPGGATATAVSGPIIVPGLTNGTAYTFTVRARTTIGLGAASATSAAVTPSAGASLPATTTPWQPWKPSAKPVSGGAQVAFFRPPSNGGAAITGYTVTASPGGATATGTSSPIAVPGLADGRYTFTVAATNAVGAGPPSQATPQITLGTPAETVPGAPTVGVATAGNASATVAFTPPTDDGGAAILGYTATASPGGQTGSSTSSPVTVTGLTNGTPYTFTVRAVNEVGAGAPSGASGSATPNAGAKSVVATTERTLTTGTLTAVSGIRVNTDAGRQTATARRAGSAL